MRADPDRQRSRDLRRGFTLIELLVSFAIATTLATLAWTAFYQMRKMAIRNQGIVDLGQEAGYLYRRFDDDIARTLQQVQLRVEVVPLAAAEFGAGSNAVRLIGMMELFSRTPTQYSTMSPNEYYVPELWYCWEWRPPRLADRAADPKAPGSLWYSRSSDWRRYSPWFTVGVTDASGSTTYGNMQFAQMAQARRSRQRELEDNDLRLLEGAANAPLIRLFDDRADLLGGGSNRIGVPWPNPAAPVTMRMAGFSIAWVDYAGWTTTVTTAGVAVTDADGNTVSAPPATPWWTANQRVVDGLFRDARDIAADAGQSALSARPGLIRLSFSLYDRASGVLRPFIFSLTPDLGAPTAAGL